MLDDATRALLEAGSSTIIGMLDSSGAPFATRGWGSLVLDGEPLRIRVVVGAGAFASAGRALGSTDRFAIAATGADVHTLRSAQVKGSVVAIEPVDDDDLARFAAFCDDFFGAVEATDNIPRDRIAWILPSDFWACTFEVDEVYDQTPGPSAGSRLDR